MKKFLKSILLMATLTIMTLGMSALVSAAEAPGKVTGLQQTRSYSNSLSFEWSALLEDCRYETQISADGKTWKTESEGTFLSNESISGLNSGTTYYVRVRAYTGQSYNNTQVYGPYSDVLPVATNPKSIDKVWQADATTSSVTIAWSAAAGATSYQIYYRTNGAEIFKAEVGTTSYTISGLKNTEALPFDYIEIKPVRSAGAYKAAGTTKSLDTYYMRLISAKIKNLYVSNYFSSLKEVYLGWDKPEYYDGYQYQLYKMNGKKPVSTGVSASSSVYIKNVKNNQFYKVRVRGYVTVNGKNLYGDWSDYLGLCHQPDLTLKRSGRNIKISWKKVKNAKNYSVYVSLNSKSGYKKVATTKKASYKLTKFKKKKLNRKKTYYIYVIANAKMGKKTVKSNKERYWYLI